MEKVVDLTKEQKQQLAVALRLAERSRKSLLKQISKIHAANQALGAAYSDLEDASWFIKKICQETGAIKRGSN